MKLVLFLNLLIIAYGSKNATTCNEEECVMQDRCRCSSSKNPLQNGKSPQLIALTISESIVQNLYDEYWEPLLFNRKNPDGNPIRATFFVPHEYTDYTLVQQLYLNGFEIGVHSITKNSNQEYWRTASVDTLIEEFEGQKQILSHFANITIGDIFGARTPQLQLQGDASITAYEKARVFYDNSWPTMCNQPLFPYTLDYLSTQKCTAAISCPVESHKNFWIVPLTNIRGNKTECNSLATCGIEGTPRKIANWLMNEVNTIRCTSRVPIVLRLDSYWFDATENSYEGFRKFLDKLLLFKDIFLVSVTDILEWVNNPVPYKDYKLEFNERSGNCINVTCTLKNLENDTRYMKSCVSCPNVYPWLGNPLGQLLIADGLKTATTCNDKNCTIDKYCRCSSNKNPLHSEISPQFIALTISESIVQNLYVKYWKPLLFNRINPDGNPVGATFFVPHEYTDYTLVQELHLNGFEIGVHSITKNSSQEYWRTASLDTLTQEFEGQREILSHFANIPIGNIGGGRTPHLQLKGDVSVEAYSKGGLFYDNSWPTLCNQPLFPYTLDYLSTQQCTVAVTCPTKSHKGFWIVPLTDIHGNNTECNSLATCGVERTPTEIANWLMNEVNLIRNTTRVPIVLRLDSYWFDFTENSYEGFRKFLDEVFHYTDTFLVSVKDIIRWIEYPVPYKDYKTPVHKRSGDCINVTCSLKISENETRYMKSCVTCPNVYPWLGYPLGE